MKTEANSKSKRAVDSSPSSCDMLPDVEAQSLRQVLRRTRHGVASGLSIVTSMKQVRRLSKAAQARSNGQFRCGMTTVCAFGH